MQPASSRIRAIVRLCGLRPNGRNRMASPAEMIAMVNSGRLYRPCQMKPAVLMRAACTTAGTTASNATATQNAACSR